MDEMSSRIAVNTRGTTTTHLCPAATALMPTAAMADNSAPISESINRKWRIRSTLSFKSILLIVSNPRMTKDRVAVGKIESCQHIAKIGFWHQCHKKDSKRKHFLSKLHQPELGKSSSYSGFSSSMAS